MHRLAKRCAPWQRIRCPPSWSAPAAPLGSAQHRGCSGGQQPIGWQRSNIHQTALVRDEAKNRLIFGAKTGICCALAAIAPPMLSDCGLLEAIFPGEDPSTVQWSCGVTTLVTVVLVSEPTVSGLLSNGLYRLGATVAGGALAYATAGALQVVDAPTAQVPLMCLAITAVTGAGSYYSRASGWVKHIKAFVLFTVSYNCVLADFTYNGLDLLNLDERLFGIVTGIAIAVPIHCFVLPRYAGTHLLHTTEANIERTKEFIWRTCRAYLRHFAYSTFFSNTADTEPIHDCFAKVLVSRGKVDQELQAARWESRFGGLRIEDIERVKRVQRGMRRIAATGVSLDLFISSWCSGSMADAHSRLSQSEFQQLVAFEQASGELLDQFGGMLVGDLDVHKKQALSAKASNLEEACDAIHELEQSLLEAQDCPSHGPSRKSTLPTLHFLSLLLDMGREMKSLASDLQR